MPGHIGTSIVANSRRVLSGREDDTLAAPELERARKRIAAAGLDVSLLTDEAVQGMIREQARRFLEEAPTTAAEAAAIILDGVRAERWRILVGEDAGAIDERVRRDPEAAYEPEFFQMLAREAGWRVGR
jgi:hypothetical protein